MKDRKRLAEFMWSRMPGLYKHCCDVVFMGKQDEMRRKAVEKLELEEGDTVVDLACGTGLNFPYLSEAVGKEGMVIGVDYSKEMLYTARNYAAENHIGNLKLVCSDAAGLTLDTKVDGIISVLGISVMKDTHLVLRKAADALKDNCNIVIMDASSDPEKLAKLHPLVRKAYSVYKKFGKSYNESDVRHELEVILGNKVEVERHNLRFTYLMTGKKL